MEYGQQSLFENRENEPLASRMRPETLDDYAGQKHLLGKGMVLRKLIESDRIPSMIFWGPPGTGKTTLARIIARMTKAEFINFSAVTSGIKEIRDVMRESEKRREAGFRTIVFVDEIHRFNKAQQDAFLPFVEKGSIILIGATTENPSFEVNGALLSRCRVFVLKQLTTDDIVSILEKALSSPEGLRDDHVSCSRALLERIAVFSNGDARTALSVLEMAAMNAERDDGGEAVITKEDIEQCTTRKSLLYDRNGEEHYNIISALHKSMRNSDPDAAVYWLARMLEAGEDPIYIARRVTRFAAEDVGLADPNALRLAVAAFEACRLIGMPECSVHLSEAVIYLSLAPKSNSAYLAYERAKRDAAKDLDEPVPMQIRNAPTRLMKDLGFGKGYEYAHDAKDKITGLVCLPERLIDRSYYRPTEEGVEKTFAQKLRWAKYMHRKLKEEKNAAEGQKPADPPHGDAAGGK